MTDWMDDAKCRDFTPEQAAVFFPESKKGHGTNVTYRKAREVCAGCPVVDDCLEHALRFVDLGSGWRKGMFGGKTPDERDKLARGVRRCTICGTQFRGVRAGQCSDECREVARVATVARHREKVA